jgi:hypothetical protein
MKGMVNFLSPALVQKFKEVQYVVCSVAETILYIVYKNIFAPEPFEREPSRN